MSKISDQLRKEYMQTPLNEEDLLSDPIEQFQKWFYEAVEAEIDRPNAMTLATVSPDGKPSARVVLLKEFDEKGFVFFTNYESRKGQHLAENPNATLVFWWPPLERQVRIEGYVTKVSPEESDAYFHTRPRGAQLGAQASNQSQVVSMSTLNQRIQALVKQFEDRQVPRPAHWGGYRLQAVWIEFWQGRPDRLHDRLCYRLQPDRSWIMERLSP